MKMIKKIASVACAALLAAQMAVGVSAATAYYSSSTGKYYTTYSDALAASNGHSEYVKTVYDYYSDYGYRYYSSLTGKYYSTYEAALNASNGNSAYVTYYYTGSYVNRPVTGYYSTYTGEYYSTYTAALYDSKNISSYVVPVYSNIYVSGDTGAAIYKYYYNGVFYPTLDEAKAAGGKVGVDIYYTYFGDAGSTTYYYYYNGTYYGSLQAAKDAGGTAVGTDITYVPYNYYHNANSYYYPGYVGTTTPTYVFNKYYDPFYVYRNHLASNSTSSSSSSSSSKNVETGTPYIYGNKSKAGWDTLVKIINNAKSGASYTVDMNGATTVTQSVMQALKGKNVTMTFVLDNGVKWTINGKNISSAKDVVVYTELGIDYIPQKLVAKASKDAISKSQLGISATFDKLGTKANVTVKFNSKRAGCTAVVYRYDPDTNALKGVCKAKVQDNGNCTITVDQGGPYLIVLK